MPNHHLAQHRASPMPDRSDRYYDDALDRIFVPFDGGTRGHERLPAVHEERWRAVARRLLRKLALGWHARPAGSSVRPPGLDVTRRS